MTNQGEKGEKDKTGKKGGGYEDQSGTPGPEHPPPTPVAAWLCVF